MSVNFTYALVKTLSSTCPVFRLGRFYSENIQLLNMRSEKCFSFSLNDFEKTFFALSRTIQCSIYENCFSTYLLASAMFNVRLLFLRSHVRVRCFSRQKFVFQFKLKFALAAKLLTHCN